MTHGFPQDEVRPITCVGYGPNYENSQDLRNDVLGNYSVTLLDSLDTFIIMGDYERFVNGVELIKNHISFDIDSTVQVFETSIRALGALLTCHMYAVDEKRGFKIDGYNNELLFMAYDLGHRLLPAYQTKTGIPFARVNLKHGIEGVPPNLLQETCTAGAGSPMLEMTLLSKLTGDSTFETVSKNAFMTLWESRSTLDLLSMSLNPNKGKWLDSVSGIGASIDSFFEYALKGAILFDDPELFNVWEISYKALSVNSKNTWFFTNVNVENGFLSTYWIDSLSAFFSGLQVLAGKVDDAIKTHIMYLKLWNTFGSIPERWNFHNEVANSLSRAIALEWYPLRPEFIESTYYLYRATKDPLYLQIGVGILRDFQKRFISDCGFSGIQDIRTNKKQDRMESFVLSETLKYLYLLFDEDNPIHHDTSTNIIFSTEGHPMWLDKQMTIPYSTEKEEEEKDEPEEIVIDDVPDNEVFDTSNGAIWKIPKELMGKLPTSATGMIALISKTFSNHDFLFKKLKSYYSTGRKRSLDYNQLLLQSKLNRSDMVGIEEFGLVLNDEDFTTLHDVCELNPLPNDGRFFSKLLSWDKFYEIDDRFKGSLKKPAYLEKYGHQELELESKFYDIWCDSKNSQCLRSSNTETFEVLFGDKDNVRFAQIDRVKEKSDFQPATMSSNESLVMPGDLWVPKLDGIRVQVEKLLPGKVDSRNEVISSDYVDELRKENLAYDPLEVYDLAGLCTAESCPKILRVLAINGKAVGTGSIVWVTRASIERLMNSQISLNVGKSGMVLLNNEPVQNMFLWD
ncbi:alpha-1,2-mannosidase [Saccharomycopsis crataegensis]|uniref:alpha-1,2-Mannosidase n=1 Tax=Saccharomycopsis crataegensis TaxID=43959 RepID=A0AAV5QTD2_9ASCO|nr:alpha-1,2-mannosidase [Saccharomycopsis crataegensis]